ncbi:isocitrate dehydrogenase [NAD] subunit beta, mitochondrial isoform X1 [Halictus rubicundus]|uniref:isocitrate dehydrogenase [NAD] subunit beta, mitochondrial isoform X1 n=1 Tax=Halictus rubicundus TaxID=77578 RepID=UPI0040355342
MALLARNVCKIFSQFYLQTTQKGAIAALHVSAVHQQNVPIEREGKIKCTLIPGDGVGPELVVSVQSVFKAINIPVEFEPYFLSEVNPTLSAPLEQVSNSIARNRVCLKGILATPDHSMTGELQTLNMKLRKSLDLYSNVVHVKSLPGVKCRHKNVDCIIIREQTEGEYSALEHESVKGVVECLKIVTATKSQRIAKFAFDYAVKHNRKKVTCVHKANIMKLGDGLFLKSCQEIAKLYPKITFETMIVDNCTMQMVSNPHQFDVMVLPNLYGNIVDNLASGLVGGAGVVAGASYSPECVVFEPGARHTYSEAVGKNVANPTAMLLCAVKLLRHVNLKHYAEQIKDALNHVLNDGKVLTKDLGGQNSTTDFTNAIIHRLR